MRSFETETGQTIDIRVTGKGKVLIAIDGEVFILTGNDSARLSDNLGEAGKQAKYEEKSGNGTVQGPFA